MPISSAGLSFVPNVSIANSLTNGGAASISRSPTSSTGERQARLSPASSSATPSATPAVDEPGEDGERPATAAAARRWLGGGASGADVDDVVGGHGTGSRARGHRHAERDVGPAVRRAELRSRRSRSTARSMASRDASGRRRRSPSRRSVGAIVVPAS